MSHEPRIWQHDGQWRVQDHRPLILSDGTVQDAWESRRDEDGCVLLFATEELAREYMQDEAKKVRTSS